jgi:hypothetical protein
MTMERKARENQHVACGVEGATARDLGDAFVGFGLSVNQKKRVEERKTGRNPLKNRWFR